MKLLNKSEKGLGEIKFFQIKMYALIVLSLFLISIIPPAIAQPEPSLYRQAGAGAGTPVKETEGKTTNTEAPGRETSQCMQRLLKAKPNLLNNKAQEICVKTSRLQKSVLAKTAKLKNLTSKPNFEKYRQNLEFKARALTKVKLEKARTNFLKAKDNFLKARERYEGAHQKFSEAKLKVEECKEEETEKCMEIKEQIKEHAKESLTAIADRILEHLEKLKAKVESNEDLSEEEAAEIIAKIGEQKTSIEEAKNIIETSETKEQVEASQEAATDSVDTSTEASEIVDKLPAEASEKSSEDKAVSGGGGEGDYDDNDAQIISELKPREFPPRRVMKQQVHTALVKEENRLLKEARKHSRKGDYFELNNVVEKIREIRLIIAQLARDTAEVIKNLWMKYVFNKR